MNLIRTYKASLVALLFSAQSLLAQQVHRGVVQDAQTAQPVAYATVGLLKENTGVSTDTTGHFELSSPKPQPNDTLLFQALGYQSLKLAVSAFSGTPVSLTPGVRDLAEVRISPKTLLQIAVLNKNGKSSHASYNSAGYVTQIAQHLTAPALPALLTSVSIRKLHIPLAEPANGLFRLRIYGRDPETNGPGEDLCSQSIEVMARGSEVEVDLRPYKIYLPEKDFFVAVEWLKIPANEHWYNTKEAGKKVRRFGGYWPSIEFSKTETATQNMWHQLYTGEWKQMSAEHYHKAPTNFAIEAQVRY